MSIERTQTVWNQQRPPAGQLVLDHTAHFVPDMDRAAAALARLGFRLTPLSVQQHRTSPDAPLTPAGSANRTAMLRAGYLEFLTTTADTPVAQRMRAAMARYTGIHLVCFGTSEADRLHAHLNAAGFAPQPPVSLQRHIDGPDRAGTARFTVLRVPPEAMPEGRIQIVEHHTPELLWQPRWLDHPNRAVALAAAVIAVEDPEAAATRYARFAQTKAQRTGRIWRVATPARGAVLLTDANTLRERFDVTPPAHPWIAAIALESDDIAATRAVLQDGGLSPCADRANEIAVLAPPELGGIMLFTAAGTASALLAG